MEKLKSMNPPKRISPALDRPQTTTEKMWLSWMVKGGHILRCGPSKLPWFARYSNTMAREWWRDVSPFSESTWRIRPNKSYCPVFHFSELKRTGLFDTACILNCNSSLPSGRGEVLIVKLFFSLLGLMLISMLHMKRSIRSTHVRCMCPTCWTRS